ncbi:MAG: HD domain-containing protein [Cytophagales bacterium]|nr:HD domain-containing protein [Cytophagales bacterium]
MKKEITAETENYVRKLLKKLPPYLTYHNINHTTRVVDSVITIACNCDLSEDEKEILVLSAWFHDTGFIKTYRGHEEESQQIASAFLALQNYPREKIKLVNRCIDATRISHHPKDLLEKIIRDADLYHLANSDYFTILENLKKEWEHVHRTRIKDEVWFVQNLNFLATHRYYTSYCQQHLKEKKQENLFKNLQKVATYKCSI